MTLMIVPVPLCWNPALILTRSPQWGLCCPTPHPTIFSLATPLPPILRWKFNHTVYHSISMFPSTVAARLPLTSVAAGRSRPLSMGSPQPRLDFRALG